MSKFLDLGSDIVVPGPLIAFTDSRPLVAPAPFMDAVDHWRFGVLAGDRAGLVNGTILRLGLAVTDIVSNGSGYTSRPTATFSGGGANGLIGQTEINGGIVYSVGYSGQPINDDGAVTVTLSGGGGSGAAVTMGRGTEPIYSEYYATLGAGNQNGLVSNIDDALVFSEAYLIRRPNAAQRIGGTLKFVSASRGYGVGGDGYAWSADGAQLQIQGRADLDDAITPPATWAIGKWGVLIVSYTGSTRTAMLFGPDGVPITAARSYTKNLADPQRKRAIGGIHWDFGLNNAPIDISSYAYWNYALSPDQMLNRAFDMLDYARDTGLFN